MVLRTMNVIDPSANQLCMRAHHWPLSLLLFIASCAISEISYGFDKNRGLKAVTLSYPPYEYIENNQPTGIAIDIIRELAARTGVNSVSFGFHPWKWSVSLTKEGHSDLLFNAGVSEERQKWGHYVESTLILQKYYLFAKKGYGFSVNPNFDNVKDRSIAIRLGYLYGDGPFRQALDNDQFGSVTLSYSTKQSVNLLLNDRVDMIVGDFIPINHYLIENHLEREVVIIKTPGSNSNMRVLTWPTYLLFSKKSVDKLYVDEVNQALEEMKKTGSYQSIFQKYGYSPNDE